MTGRNQIATVFGVGHTIYIPATAAALLALSLAMLMVSLIGHWLVWMSAAALIFIGFRACAAYALHTAQWEPAECVIDGFAAVMLICCFMPLFLPSWFCALIVFRLLVHFKPWPLWEVGKLMEPGPRLMLDDLLAAIPAVAAGWAVYFISLLFIGF